MNNLEKSIKLPEKSANKIILPGSVHSEQQGDYTINNFNCPICGRELKNGSPFKNDTYCCGYNWDFEIFIVGIKT